jgi:fumarate hydratase class II
MPVIARLPKASAWVILRWCWPQMRPRHYRRHCPLPGLRRSTVLVTALAPVIGYDAAAKVYKGLTRTAHPRDRLAEG